MTDFSPTSWAVALNLLLVLVLVLVLSNSAKLLGPKTKHEGDFDVPYETGLPPLEPAFKSMSVLYYKLAVLFVVFDVDLAFLLPWALSRPALDPQMLAAVTFFTAILGLMLAYLWRRGALECR